MVMRVSAMLMLPPTESPATAIRLPSRPCSAPCAAIYRAAARFWLIAAR